LSNQVKPKPTNIVTQQQKISHLLNNAAGNRWYTGLLHYNGDKVIDKTDPRGARKSTLKSTITLEMAADLYLKTYANPRFQRPPHWEQEDYDEMTLTILRNDPIPTHYVEDIVENLLLDQKHGHLTPEDKDVFIFYLGELKRHLSNLDCNNRFTYYHNVKYEKGPYARVLAARAGETFTCCHGNEWKIPEEGWLLSEMDKPLQKIWLSKRIDMDVYHGNTAKESSTIFYNFNKSGGPTPAEKDNSIPEFVVRDIREFLYGTDMNDINSSPVSGLLGEHLRWLEDKSQPRAKIHMNFIGAKGSPAILKRRALDRFYQLIYYMFVHRSNSFDASLGTVKSDDRLHNFLKTNADGLHGKNWGAFSSKFVPLFLQWWNANTVPRGTKKEETRKDPTNTQVFDTSYVLFEMVDSKLEIRDVAKFIKAMRKMDEDLITAFPELTDTEVKDWEDATEEQQKTLRNPNLHDWKGISKNVYNATIANFRKGEIKKYFKSNFKKLMAAGAIRHIRTNKSSTQCHEELFKNGQYAPNVTEDDALGFGDKLNVDHYIPRKDGGADDITNFILVKEVDHLGCKKEGKPARGDKKWVDHWEDLYGPEARQEFEKHWEKNGLEFLELGYADEVEDTGENILLHEKAEEKVNNESSLEMG